jgi:predicted nucleotidyltransferase
VNPAASCEDAAMPPPVSPDGLLRSTVDPTVAVDPKEVARVVEELFPEALGVWIYGSFADGGARADSDLDIAILPDRPLDGWDVFERAQDVVEHVHRDADLVDLTRVSDVLRHEVFGRGIRVAAREPLVCDRFEVASMAKFLDLNDAMRDWLREIRERGTVY